MFLKTGSAGHTLVYPRRCTSTKLAVPLFVEVSMSSFWHLAVYRVEVLSSAPTLAFYVFLDNSADSGKVPLTALILSSLLNDILISGLFTLAILWTVREGSFSASCTTRQCWYIMKNELVLNATATLSNSVVPVWKVIWCAEGCRQDTSERTNCINGVHTLGGALFLQYCWSSLDCLESGGICWVHLLLLCDQSCGQR